MSRSGPSLRSPSHDSFRFNRTLAVGWGALLLIGALTGTLDRVLAHGGKHAGPQAARKDSTGRAVILLHSRCAMCHSADLITQQRLDRAAWTREVDKMIRWGSPIDDQDRKLLIDHLARAYGPQAADTDARNEPHARADSDPVMPLPPGNVGNGKALYRAHCMDCHGRDGAGADGPPLAANPILTMDSVFLEAVRSGRGAMPPWAEALSLQHIADIRAWLRTLR